jgi:hypothetical protein
LRAKTACGVAYLQNQLSEMNQAPWQGAKWFAGRIIVPIVIFIFIRACFSFPGGAVCFSDINEIKRKD